MSILSTIGAVVVMLIGMLLSLINSCYLIGDVAPKRGEESLEDYQERVAERNLLRKHEQPLTWLGTFGLVAEALLLIFFLMQPITLLSWLLLIGIVLLQSVALFSRTQPPKETDQTHRHGFRGETKRVGAV